jgi:exodeoxyribonuclease VII large subunit
MSANVYSVAQVNSYIKNMFAQDFALRSIYVRGEVSNCKYHTSGHIYFTLKDASGTLAAVMFAGSRSGLKFRLAEGQKIIAGGSISVYERDGKYQLYARDIVLDGIGDLYQRFEELRDRLQEMGMFAKEYKQPIPAYASRVGIVTAQTGAAIRDIINISSRRNPYVQLYLYPALVQGEGAADSVVHGIRTLDAMGLDVLIVGRGGGSIEDLWAFNEEKVAYAIFNCKTPVISAVGHETDVTIADYVADLRAPTPSAAAELAVYDVRALLLKLDESQQRLGRLMEQQIGAVRSRTLQFQLKLKILDPGHQLDVKRQQLMDAENRLEDTMRRRIESYRHMLALTAARLDGLSPLKKLKDGFAFVTDERHLPVNSVSCVEPGDMLDIRLADGSIAAQVLEKSEADLAQQMHRAPAREQE